MEVKETAKHRRFLMLDKRSIAHKKNALLSLGTVTKHSANPLFKEDKHWEKCFDNLYGNITYDHEESTYRCWYSPFIVAYATGEMSQDERQKKRMKGIQSRKWASAMPPHPIGSSGISRN